MDPIRFAGGSDCYVPLGHANLIPSLPSGARSKIWRQREAGNSNVFARAGGILFLLRFGGFSPKRRPRAGISLAFAIGSKTTCFFIWANVFLARARSKSERGPKSYRTVNRESNSRALKIKPPQAGSFPQFRYSPVGKYLWGITECVGFVPGIGQSPIGNDK